MKKVLMSILLVCLTLCLFVGCSDEHDNPTPIDKSLYTMKDGNTWFETLTTGTNIQKTSITEIVFGKEIPQGKTEQDGINLTNKTDGKVKGYIEKVSDTDYKIYIVGDYIFGNTNCWNMFKGFTSLTDLDFGHFDTSQVMYMTTMFNGCSSLTELDLSKFNTSQVMYMTSMFNGCSSLTELDLSKFDTSSVSKMNSMFQNCSSLTKLNLSNFNTSVVDDMSSMFKVCTSLTELDLSSFDITSTTYRTSVSTTDMFKNVGTSQTTTIYVSEPSDWNSFSGDNRTFTTKP